MTRLLALALALALATGGCSLFHKDDDDVQPIAEQPPPQATYLKETGVRTDPEPQRDPGTAVESALAWSEKYAGAVEQLARQQEANRQLADEKRQLQQQIASLQAELTQTRKELGEANDLLIEVRRANDQWKANVLGYRDEMRSAQQAQLEALRKVLRLLGGEVAADAASVPPTPPAEGPAPAASAPATAPTKAAGAPSAPPAQGDARAFSE